MLCNTFSDTVGTAHGRTATCVSDGTLVLIVITTDWLELNGP
jgi:hypothetical protein